MNYMGYISSTSIEPPDPVIIYAACGDCINFHERSTNKNIGWCFYWEEFTTADCTTLETECEGFELK